MRTRRGLCSLLTLGVAILACALGVPAAPAASAATGAPARPFLDFGLLPIIDSLPFYVAEERGYFAAEGVDVRLRTFRSAVERDAALVAGAIDGFLGDVMATATLANSGVGVRIFSVSLGLSPEEGRIAILAAPGSGITSVGQLRHVPVAISRNSMIEYVVDQLLREAGLKPDEIEWTLIPKIPDRYTALMAGRIKAAGLPDPLADLALKNGARLVVDDSTGSNLSQSVLIVRRDRMDPRSEAIRRMLAAYRRAVRDVNANPNAFRSLLVARGSLPAELEHTYDVTPFPYPALPPRQPVERLLDWMKARGQLKPEITYDSLTTTDFLEPSEGRASP